MGPGSAVGDRPWDAATLYGLAVAVALAQLVASWAWAAGAHVTVEQVVLHDEAVAHGHADHHGGHTHGHPHVHIDRASPEVLVPVYAAADDHAGPYQDVLHGALVRRPDLLSREDGHRRDALDIFSGAQNFPPVPHKPPITP